jgi:hypothetical protein
MAEWIVCGSCSLKHSARPDGMCPRCKAPTGAAFVPPAFAGPGPEAAAGTAMPPPPPYAAPPYAARPAGDDAFPLGPRLAGFLLYANAIVTVVAMIRNGVQPTDPKSGFGGILPLLIDVGIGTYLVGGNAKVRPWAIARAVLGGVILTPILWGNSGPLAGLLQLAYSLGILLLLIGRPSTFRIALGMASAGGTLSLMLGVLLQQPLAVAARNLVASALDTTPHVEAVEGKQGRWRLTLPPDHWHEMSQRPDNVERAFLWPERNASVVVTVNPLPPGDIDLNRVADVFFQGMQRAVPGFKVEERRFVSGAVGNVLVARITVGGKAPEEGWIGVHAVEERFAVAAASAPAGASPETLEELLAVVGSLQLSVQPP